MGNGALRGYRWGRATVEVDRDTDLAARVTARFACTRGHEFTVQFAADADLPASWNCRQHSVEDCRRIDATANTPTAAKHKPARTHLVMLHERRSDAELETLLADTLSAIRRIGGARPGCVTIGGRSYSYRYDI
jgi:RNA polymerase-binding protein